MSAPTLPVPLTRDCEFPYATYDQGLLVCVLLGGCFLFAAFCLLLAIFYLVAKRKRAKGYAMAGLADAEFSEGRKKGGTGCLLVVVAFFLVAFAVGSMSACLSLTLADI
jgi:hypothetical protein